MNREFLDLLMKKTGFPVDAQAAYRVGLGKLESAGQGPQMEKTIGDFYADRFDMEKLGPKIKSIAAASGVHEYTVWGLFLALAGERAKADYLAQGVPEEIFWDTFCDLKYKVLECKEVQGVWGNFVAFWYPIFYCCDIVKLGRLEFENDVYRGKPYVLDGLRLEPGDPVKSIHIPSSGEPFNTAARLNNYKKAYDFFKPTLGGGPLWCVCDSWLLLPAWQQVLSPTGNILDFQRDFDVISHREEEEFADSWRLFGADYQKPTAKLPERTSMQRAVKKYLLAGGKTGEGFGILCFDGERLRTRT